ncbi:MAG TPA: hypothetical protein VIV60_29995 [Polyangiaceae bacterium]
MWRTGSAQVGLVRVKYDEHGKLTGASVKYGPGKVGIDGEGISGEVGSHVGLQVGPAKEDVEVKAAEKLQIPPQGSRSEARDQGAPLQALDSDLKVKVKAKVEIDSGDGTIPAYRTTIEGGPI